MRFIRDVRDFCYPHRCARCEASAASPFLCTACEGELDELVRRPACEKCAKPLGGTGGTCPYCEGEGLRPFDRIVALGAFRDPIRRLIYAAKYHGRWTVAEELADRLLKEESAKGLLSKVDCLVAVPLHRFRQIVRGFNQAEVIARYLAKKTRKRVERPVIRLRNTETQTHLHSRAQREENLKDAFGLIDKWSVRDRHVLLIDDVMTTGATLQSVARTLRHAEPASLSAMVIAVADPLGRDFQAI